MPWFFPMLPDAVYTGDDLNPTIPPAPLYTTSLYYQPPPAYDHVLHHALASTLTAGTKAPLVPVPKPPTPTFTWQNHKLSVQDHPSCCFMTTTTTCCNPCHLPHQLPDESTTSPAISTLLTLHPLLS